MYMPIVTDVTTDSNDVQTVRGCMYCCPIYVQYIYPKDMCVRIETPSSICTHILMSSIDKAAMSMTKLCEWIKGNLLQQEGKVQGLKVEESNTSTSKFISSHTYRYIQHVTFVDDAKIILTLNNKEEVMIDKTLLQNSYRIVFYGIDNETGKTLTSVPPWTWIRDNA
jgi:hypothetical protein